MVGVVRYYTNQADALAGGLAPASSGSYTVQSELGYNFWIVASNSTGSSPPGITFGVGYALNPSGSYFLYPAAVCFKEGSKILCQVDGKETNILVENLVPGTLVKTSRDGLKKVALVGKGTIENPGSSERIESRLYKCSADKYPELKEDLIITGCHSILVDELTEEQRADTIKRLGKIFVTDRKYRLMACVDERAEPLKEPGVHTIYHFALEDEDELRNFGVYANGGLLVETCSIKTLKNKSNLVIV